ncbi:restriction endonuclease subunit S [Limosilactobacillus reuteri]|uniref:restriction endonuclease subunit S n=1 Tax=Limosilactobacillus reuteri TaxID=1598 RepID=UPI00399592E2
MLSATQDKGMIPRSSTGIDIKYEKKSLRGYKKIEPGDFVVHLRSFQGGFAYSDLTGIVSPAYTVFTFKQPEMFNNYFWKEKFTSYNFIQLLKKVTYGVRDGRSISYSDFLTLNEKFPVKVEQTKIADLFKIIDNLITLQQRKLEILIKLKRSFLTKSMVNSLDKNPELYFNSASVKWLKQKLSDLTIKEFKGNTKLNDTKPGKTEYLDAERLNGNVPLFIDKPINTLKSDILILWDGSKAGSVYYGFEGSLGSTLKAIRLNPKLVNSFFVYQQLKSKQDVIFNKYRTPNIPHVIKNFTKVYPIYFPSMAVQNKIARFLGNLDTLIEIQQKSIKDHKVIKKYLLQKLFI